ncbi:MAG: CoA pyrophosphatase [Firmicutes bacterium]|nr:CoA pyrophosphatase [Bacillota bacterium]
MEITFENIRNKLDGRPVGVVGKRKEYAVLMPLVEKNGEVCLLFEVRSRDIRQPGDVCFPGGRVEEGEAFEDTALRETFEEIGIPRDRIEVYGRFDSMLEVNRIRMHTLVGRLPDDWESLLDTDSEVAEVFTVPLRFFRENEPDYYRGKIIQDTEGFPYEKHGIDSNYKWREAYQDLYFWHYAGHTIWGLTAAITLWFTEEIL